MYNARLPIPPGFVVTSESYKKFLQTSGIQKNIQALLENLDVEDTEKLQETAKEIQTIILKAEMPTEIKNEIQEAYDNLNISPHLQALKNNDALSFIKSGQDSPYVAVRSSATAEDLPEASFAGQQSSFLNIKGTEKVIQHVQKCWASLYTARAIYYRTKNNFEHSKVYIAVVVQKMVNADAAGVMFTVNPSTNNKEEIMIEAAFGLGDVVVGGDITPDTYLIEKESLKLKSKKQARQLYGLFRDPMTNQTIKKEFSEEKGKKQKITDEAILKIAEAGKLIDQHYQKPMDIEWAIEENRIYIVQARPVTTLVEKKQEAQETHEQPGGEKLLEGLAASPGIGSGKVKLVKDMDELSKIKEGDILVTQMTSPDMVSAMQKAVAIVTDEGGMTCFKSSTKVLTNKGLMSLEDLYGRFTKGETFEVASIDESSYTSVWRKLNGIIKKKGKVSKVEISPTLRSTQNFIECTKSHKFLTLKNRRLIKKPLNSILEDQEGVLVCDKISHISKSLENRKKAYLMGSIFSDGTFQKNKRGGYVVRFFQNSVEKKLPFIQEVHSCLGSSYSLNFSEYLAPRNENEMTLSCYSKLVYNDFKSIKENILHFVLNADEISLYYFLSGFIDGDGHSGDHQINITVGESKKIYLEAIICAALRLGIHYSVVRDKNWYHILFSEGSKSLLENCKRVSKTHEKKFGNKSFLARQIIGDIIDEVNYRGRIKSTYINKNRRMYDKKVKQISSLCNQKAKQELNFLLDSDLRMNRVKEVENHLEEENVYDLWVDSSSDLGHNYLVFTSNYTPLIVSNCHAAIVSRELGIPAVVGTEKATKLLQEEQEITVDGTHGIIYSGAQEIEEEIEEESQTTEYTQETTEPVITATKIYMNLGVPEMISKYKDLPFDGIGLMRLEFIVTNSINKHPLYLLQQNQGDFYTEKLVEGIQEVASTIAPRPLIVRLSDFKTNEYKNLEGGSEFEPHEENPMLGWRGVSRYISEDFKEAFKLECKAIQKLRETNKNVHIMLPFVRTIDEVKQCLSILEEYDLVNSETFHIYLMAEIPSIALLAEDFAQLPIAGASIGSNDLTQMTLGVDRDSAKLGKMGYFDEKNPAVLKAISMIVQGFKKHGKTTSLCGQAGSRPDMAEFLVKQGIDAISVNPDAVPKIRNLVASIERKILLDNINTTNK